MIDVRDMILALDIYFKHNWYEVYKAIVNKDTTVIDEPNNNLIIEAEKLHIIHEGYKILYIGDEEYPKNILKFIIRPPFIIYYKGDIETVENRFDSDKYDPNKGCFLD